MPLNHNTPVFGDFNKPARDLGVLKAIDVTIASGNIGTAAHGLGRVPNICIPVMLPTDGSIPVSAACMNAATATNGCDSTNVYVVCVSSAVVKVYVG